VATYRPDLTSLSVPDGVKPTDEAAEAVAAHGPEITSLNVTLHRRQ
jgi:hypothetical protein